MTDDLRAVIEELSGRSFDQFFDQWLYHAHQPELDVNYSWDQVNRLAKLSIRQVQKLDANVLLFRFPLVVRFEGPFGTVDKQIEVAQKEEDFYFALGSAPKLVRLDPEYTLLAKISFSIPSSMLAAELADRKDMIGRLLAIDQLAKKRDRASISELKKALNSDPFYGVRIEASKALGNIHSDDALDALLASARQSDARVRRQVVSDIGDFYRENAGDFARQALSTEKNPAIISSALVDLAGYATPEAHNVLVKFLNSESYRNELANAAISAMRLQDDPAYIAPLLDALAKRESDFTTRGFSQGLRALAYLARNQEKKDEVREFLTRFVNSRKKAVQLSSLGSLGVLGDPQAIGILEKFASASKESREQAAAERAVADLRAARKPVDDFKNLRREVMDLEKANRELRKDLDELQKKVEAAKPAAAPAKRRLVSPKR